MTDADLKVVFGTTIKSKRSELGMSQEELADRLGISQGTISKVISGMQPFPQEFTPQLVSALGYPLSFYGREWDDEPDSPFYFRRRMTAKSSDLKRTEARRRIIRRQIKELLGAIDRKPPTLPRIAAAEVRDGGAACDRAARAAQA